MNGYALWISAGAGIIALLYAILITNHIDNYKVDHERINYLSNIIQRGAMAFLYREYRALVPFVIVVSCLLAWKLGVPLAVSFLLGAFCSGISGFLGMKVATRANGKTAFAAMSGMNQALKIAFWGGSVMGMTVVGVGEIGRAHV